ncbi:alpha/beta fold hydrolase [Mycobacterium ostraviense]|uniref:alpha/beta fold hydrolase n=1 Tax=Mycobacterium ostraviense TaxID=2738409 RepID=UPI000AE9F186|nr:alpha/beta hydrolase [Mycobacterium ostraviense]UGT91643.1 alpha/beta hydrolase [Mycobacterium ostraviense]
MASEHPKLVPLLRVPAGINSHQVDVQAIHTRVYEVDPRNDLTPLILLHGGGVDSALVSFGSALTTLGKHRRVIAPDLPGYGDTAFPDSSCSVPWYGEWVAALIRRFGLDLVDLGGSSLGGWITLNMALNHPEVLRRIIAINPGGITENFKLMHLTKWVAAHPRLANRTTRLSVSMGRRFTRRQLRSGLGMKNASALTDELIDAVIASGKRPRAGEAFAATQRWALTAGAENLSLVEKLPQIRAKTLILAGRNDKLVPVADSIRASQLVQDGQVRVFESCGHWFVRDCPTQFLEAVNRFLDTTH